MTSDPTQAPGLAENPAPAGPLELLAGLRADLRAADYTVEGVAALVGDVASAALDREQPLPALRATAGSREPAAVLLRCATLGRAVTRAELDAALPRTRTAGAAALGLVAAAGEGPDDEVRPLVDLRPYSVDDAGGVAQWWLVSDLGELATGEALSADHVLGVGGASLTLASATVRTPVGRVLDVGTGCGIQALHASRHARRVTATDTSERALDLAAVNAALNEVSLDLRHGSLFGPVRDGELFDLVVSNPPFVITPRTSAVPTYEYRDGGMPGDSLVARIVAEVGPVLAPGGVAQLLGNWELHDGQSWSQRVESWLEGTGLDAWVVQREVADPALYAETWIRDGGQKAGPRFDELYAAWLDDFAARGVTGVGFGVVTLRRPQRPGTPLRRFEENLAALDDPLGEVFARGLATHDRLAGLDEAGQDLGDLTVTVAADVTDERFHTPGDPDPRIVLLRQGGGLRRVAQVDGDLAGLVGACDGELTLGQITAGLAVLGEEAVGDVRTRLYPRVRSLLEDGFLLLP
ncbi:methyltransferase [Kineococcus sp. TBRC 1896]|uniref:Methyltransferase n=1 Tax=Kineococcus mangrovi TaxID=1660183 RepID=A0ABV4I328_9ACTN